MTLQMGDTNEQTTAVHELQASLHRACAGIYPHRANQLLDELSPYVHTGTSKARLFELAIRLTVEKTSLEEPDWQYVAGRLYLQPLYEEASQNRGYGVAGYGDFSSWFAT